MSDWLNLGFLQGLKSRTGAVYCNLQQLGSGGSATTYLALATSGSHPGLLFALKIFRRLSKPEWRKRFLEEMAFLSECDHPAIMRVFDEGLYRDEHPFFVAEFLPQTLAGAMRAPLSMVEKLSYSLQLLSALEYLARPELSVVHRDIKPQNIFIKGSSCVLGDFGLIKHHDPDPDLDRQMLKESFGPRMPRFYRTPDLVAYLNGGPPPTPQSDVFQLGLVLAELFTKRNPQKPFPDNDFGSPVEMEPLDLIPGTLGKPIKALIDEMLISDSSGRPSASNLLSRWQPVFLQAAKQVHILEGKVI